MRTLAVALLLTMGCEPSTSARHEAGPSRPAGDGSRSSAADGHLTLAYRAPAAVVEVGRSALDFAGQAIEAASVGSGSSGPRTFGTLTESAGGRVAYSGTPSDRLIVERADGRRIEIIVRELMGSGGDATGFFQGDHAFRVDIVGDELMAELSSSRRGSARSASIRGRVVVAAGALDVDLTLEGMETFDSDSSGSRFYDDHSLMGTLNRGADRLQVDEHWTFELVSARRGATDSRSQTASSVVRTTRSTGDVNGQRHEWRDVRTQKAFRDGKPTELDTFWDGSGDVAVNGVVVGSVEGFAEAHGDSGGFVGFELEMVNEAVVLERFVAY